MSAQNTQTAYFSQTSSRLSSSTPEVKKTITDTVNISNEAKNMLLSSPFSSTGSNTIHVRDIEESLANATSYVEKHLQSLYSKHGISSNSNMEISVGRDGSILVNGENPASESLAKEINDDKELSNSIRKMSANASLLEAIKKHEEFAAAYDKDPIAAVERYGYLLEDGHDYHVSFSMQDGHIDTKVAYI
jgi:hypothetical protein